MVDAGARERMGDELFQRFATGAPGGFMGGAGERPGNFGDRRSRFGDRPETFGHRPENLDKGTDHFNE